jgi:hypothetical protein
MLPPRHRKNESGSTSVQIVVILVPVLFAFIGFAVDLGRIYLIRGELQTAANSMALAAAARLNGTEAAPSDAIRQAQLTIEPSSGFANRFDFGGRTIGASEGLITSEVFEPAFYDSLSAATGGGGSGSGTMKYVRIHLRADAPLVFFAFLPIATERKTPIEVAAVAGVSAPLCTACGIEPIAIAAPDAGDTTNFGFVSGTLYTFGYVCTGVPAPANLADTSGRVPYLLLNRLNDQATVYSEESQQAYRNGAAGMPPSTTQAQACMTIASDETIWVNAAPQQCSTSTIAAPVTAFLCGMATRFDSAVPAGCSNVSDVDSLAALYLPDSDLTDIADYPSYAGNNRRLITVAIVETLDAGGPMQALGFRQFLVEPNSGDTTITPGDTNGRFRAMYVGNVLPLKQGRIEGCQQTSGPGKVVIHQ